MAIHVNTVFLGTLNLFLKKPLKSHFNLEAVSLNMLFQGTRFDTPEIFQGTLFDRVQGTLFDRYYFLKFRPWYPFRFPLSLVSKGFTPGSHNK